MSRSYWKTPIMGITGHPRMKWWRSQEHRRYRAYVRDMIKHERYDDIQDFKGRFGNEWDSPRDGLSYFGDMKNMPCSVWFYYTAGGREIKMGCESSYRGHIHCHKYYLELMRK